MASGGEEAKRQGKALFKIAPFQGEGGLDLAGGGESGYGANTCTKLLKP